MSRISDLASNTALVQILLNTQKSLHTLGKQVASEKAADDYMTISQNSERLVNIENTRDSLQSYMKANDIAGFRLDLQMTAIDSLDSELRNFRDELGSLRMHDAYDETSITNVQKMAFDRLKSMEAYLNLDINGRYVFAGSRTDTQPVSFGLTTLAALQDTYDGARVTFPTSRDAHLERMSLSEDDLNENTVHIDSSNFLQFRQDSDGVATNAGSSTIRATSALFSNLSVGATISVTNTADNNGTYTVESLSSDGTTVTVKTEMLADETLPGAVATEAGAAGVTFLLEDSSTLTPGGNITFDATNRTITDDAAAGLFAGFSAGDFVTVSGSASNNGTFRVDSVDASNNFITVTQHPTTVTLADGTTTVTNQDTGTLTFSRSGDTITAATAGAFSGVNAGEVITITGTDENDGTWTVGSVDATGTIITVESKKLTDEGLSGTTFFDLYSDTDIEFTAADRKIEIRQSGTANVVPNIFLGLDVGNTITIAGTGSNDGTFTITSISSDKSSVTVEEAIVDETDTDGATIADGQLTDEAGAGAVAFTLPSGSTLTNATTGNITFDQSSLTITAATASSLSGISVGDFVTVTGSTSNNGTYRVAANDGTTLTVEGSSYTSGTQMAFTDVGAAGTDTIQLQDTGGTAIEGAFRNLKAGETFTVSGTAAHDGTYTISSISDDGSTITVSEDITATATDTDGARVQVFAADGTISATPYYSGDSVTYTHRIDKDRNFEEELTAIDPAFEKAIRSMFMIAQGKFGTEGGLDQAANRHRIKEALSLVNSALDPMTEGRSNVAQVDNVTLAGTIEAGDQYTITVNGTSLTYSAVSGNSLNDIRDQLIALINATAAINGTVTATAGDDGGVRITADTAGTGFKTASYTTNGGVISDNSATAMNHTANYQAVDHGTAADGTKLTSNLESVTRIMGFRMELLKSTKTLHKNFVSFLNENVSEIEDADMLSVVTKLTDQARVLEAAYSALARIRQLSFHNYL